MTDDERCARCGRAVRLPSLVPGGRVCSNCRAILAAAPCTGCGDGRRVDGRDAEGRPWCATCRARTRATELDRRRQRQIVDAVRGAAPAVTAGTVEAVLASAVASRRSLRWLAEHLAAHPDALTVGPTSVLPVLDRFVVALDGADVPVATIHPVCDGCGRRRRWQARTPGGGQCSACWARNHLLPCSMCRRQRRVDHRDTQGRPVCSGCVASAARHRRLDELTTEIVELVFAAQPAAEPSLVAAAVERAAPKVPDRATLARLVRVARDLTVPSHREVRVARLLAELRLSGIDLPAARCEDCEGSADPFTSYRQVVRCEPCARRCPGCGRPAKQPTEPCCRRCEVDPRRGQCQACLAVRVLLDVAGRCRTCRERLERRCARCQATGPRTRMSEAWLCHRCALAAEFDTLIGPLERLPVLLVPVRAAVIAAANRKVVSRWLRHSAGGQLLARLAAGDVPITHEALDEAGPAPNKSVEHLRALLVAGGALADTADRRVDRLEEFVRDRLAAAAINPTDAKVARAWVRWQVLPGLRRQAETAVSMTSRLSRARADLVVVLELLETLDRDHRALANATQADVDQWFAQPGHRAWRSRPFLAWTRARRHLPRQVAIPATPPKLIRSTLDGDQRWAIARRLVTDDTIPVEHRVAAALVVLYGQPLTRIAHLTIDDIHRGSDETVVVTLDGTPMPLHEPFATLIGQLPMRRSNGVSDQLQSHWLFPGRQAGRPVSALILANRLRAMGIEPRDMRNTARAQLAGEIPPAMLVEIIGISAATATRWTAIANGNWAAYAAGRDAARR